MALNKNRKKDTKAQTKAKLIKKEVVKKENVKKSYREEKENSMQSAFIREVNEEVHNEKMKNLLKKWSKVIIFVSILIVAVAIGFILWKNYKQSSIEKESVYFQEVVNLVDKKVEEQKIDEAEKVLKDFISSAKHDYKDVAYTMLFEIYKQSRNLDAITNLMKEMSVEARAENVRDTAKLSYYVQMYNSGQADADEVASKLKDLMKKDSSYKISTYSFVISAYIEKGDLANAQKYLEKMDKEIKNSNKYNQDDYKNMVEFLRNNINLLSSK